MSQFHLRVYIYKVMTSFVLIFQVAGVYACTANLPLRLTNMIIQSSMILKNLCGALSLLIGITSSSLVLSPSSSPDNDSYLMDLITEATHNCKPHLLILGDFNFPDINWEDWSSTGDGNILLSTLYVNFLFQHIEFPTRFRENQNPLGLISFCCLPFSPKIIITTKYVVTETNLIRLC